MWPCSTCVNVLHVLQAGARTSADLMNFLRLFWHSMLRSCYTVLKLHVFSRGELMQRKKRATLFKYGDLTKFGHLFVTDAVCRLGNGA